MWLHVAVLNTMAPPATRSRDCVLRPHTPISFTRFLGNHQFPLLKWPAVDGVKQETTGQRSAALPEAEVGGLRRIFTQSLLELTCTETGIPDHHQQHQETCPRGRHGGMSLLLFLETNQGLPAGAGFRMIQGGGRCTRDLESTGRHSRTRGLRQKWEDGFNSTATQLEGQGRGS